MYLVNINSQLKKAKHSIPKRFILTKCAIQKSNQINKEKNKPEKPEDNKRKYLGAGGRQIHKH